MYLKSIKLKNFKSHKDTYVEFGNITSIIGSNSCGKTNILRALKLVLHHENWPVSWLTYGTKESSIELELTNGNRIIRKRTEKSQSTIIVEVGKDPVELEGKKDATSYISKITGIAKIELDETTGPEDLNFVNVYDGPYLLGGRSDTIQRKISGIVGANKIDDARNRLNKKYKKLNTRSKEIDNEFDVLKNQVDLRSSWLNTQKNVFSELNNLHNKWDSECKKLQDIENYSNHINNLLLNEYTLNVVNNINNGYVEVKNYFEKFKELTTKLNKLIMINYVSYPDPKNIFSLWEEIKLNYNLYKDKLLKLLNINTLNEEFINIQKSNLELINLLGNKNQRLDEIKELVKFCPTCNQIL
jgi:DNA repair exonuclease SbcCD ATPase subunit